MNSFFSVFSSLYSHLARRRPLLYCATFAVIILAAFILRNIRMNEDIKPLLPDDRSEAAKDFALLQKAPFSDKVLVSLKGDPGTGKKELTDAADMLSRAMTPPYFTRAVAGPAIASDERLPQWLMNTLPNTFTARDMAAAQKALTPEEVRSRLQNVYKQLTLPEGWFMKPLLQADPLDMRSGVLEKLRHLNVIPGMALYNNHFISADGSSALVIAKTPVKITDSKGSDELVTHLKDLIKKVVPPKIEASFVSGHAYTAANAGTIKKDLYVILTCASVAIFLLIMAFLRSWKGILVFLVPSSVLCLATAGTLLIYDSVSAVTMAFGAVLLGISDDYPILVYFALCSKERDPAPVTREVAHPVMFGGLTTIATFGVMLLSTLPGQRQLAVFSMIGVAVSLVFSLVVLPHLVHSLPGRKRYVGAHPARTFSLPRKGVLLCWLAVMAVCLWQAGRLDFNGDLKAMNFVPEELQRSERHMSKTWGNFRDSAILFAEGKDLEASLFANDSLFAYLSEKLPAAQIISLAPLFPSSATQRANAKRWADFWSGGNGRLAQKLLSEEGGKLGFSAGAFLPFFDMLAKQPGPVTESGMKETGFADLMDSMIVKGNGSVQTLTLIPDTKANVDLFSNDGNVPQGVRLVSQGRFREIIGKALVGNFSRYIVFALLVIIVSVSLLFRNLQKILLALVPVATGLVFMLGTMGALGVQFNIFNIVATILVIGLGVDLGIFMVCNITEGYEHTANLGILLGGLTSFVGIGALALAHHPALSSIGITVLLGLCGVIPSALLVVPALYRKKA
ncbi:MAG TPA: MMPL family transporter [Syntrophorhabdaceae bacterium]|nr:MMPL family transporter [Syntrophorhabdaceae bacterium]